MRVWVLDELQTYTDRDGRREQSIELSALQHSSLLAHSRGIPVEHS